jgi:hypothetical protein
VVFLTTVVCAEMPTLVQGTFVLLVLTALEHLRRSSRRAKSEADRPSAYALWKADERALFGP